jgi:chromosome segregation ATPase
MAEIGLAASIIAVIDLSAKVVSRCSEYYANVKNARDDIERLYTENQRLKETLEQVKKLCDSLNGTKLQASQDLHNGVKDCQTQLAELETRLKPQTGRRVLCHIGISALKWHFKSEEVDGMIEKLGRCRNNISSSLQADQEYVF